MSITTVIIFQNDSYPQPSTLTLTSLTQCTDFLKPFKGVYDDLRRRLPLYPSDFTDGTASTPL